MWGNWEELSKQRKSKWEAGEGTGYLADNPIWWKESACGNVVVRNKTMEIRSILVYLMSCSS